MPCYRTVRRTGLLILLMAPIMAGSLRAGESDGPEVKQEKKDAAPTGDKMPAANPSPQSFNGIIVREIEVKGNKRITTEAILKMIQTRVGAHFKDEIWDADWRRLTDSRQFLNVRVSAPKDGPKGISLFIEVVELPLVASVDVRGADERLREQLLASLKTKAGQPISQAQLQLDAAAVKRHLQLKGYENITVKVLVEKVESKDKDAAAERKVVLQVDHAALKSGGKFLPNEP